MKQFDYLKTKQSVEVLLQNVDVILTDVLKNGTMSIDEIKSNLNNMGDIIIHDMYKMTKEGKRKTLAGNMVVEMYQTGYLRSESKPAYDKDLSISTNPDMRQLELCIKYHSCKIERLHEEIAKFKNIQKACKRKIKEISTIKKDNESITKNSTS